MTDPLLMFRSREKVRGLFRRGKRSEIMRYLLLLPSVVKYLDK